MHSKVTASLSALLMAATLLATAPAHAVDKDEKPSSPTDPKCYYISHPPGPHGFLIGGAPGLNVELTFDADFEHHKTTVSGMGTVSFPYLVPSIDSVLDGFFIPTLLRGGSGTTYVFVKGYPEITLPITPPQLPHSKPPVDNEAATSNSTSSDLKPIIKNINGHTVLLIPNLELHMTLTPDMKSGTASYKYREHVGVDSADNWTSMKNMQVKKMPCGIQSSEYSTRNDYVGVKQSQAILLNTNFTNQLTVDGELGWHITPINASTGYSWSFIPDDSGVYELVEEVTLHPSVRGAVGVPGDKIWKFKGIRAGSGSILFQLYAPGDKKPVKSVYISVEVVDK